MQMMKQLEELIGARVLLSLQEANCRKCSIPGIV